MPKFELNTQEADGILMTCHHLMMYKRDSLIGVTPKMAAEWEESLLDTFHKWKVFPRSGFDNSYDIAVKQLIKATLLSHGGLAKYGSILG